MVAQTRDLITGSQQVSTFLLLFLKDVLSIVIIVIFGERSKTVDIVLGRPALPDASPEFLTGINKPSRAKRQEDKFSFSPPENES